MACLHKTTLGQREQDIYEIQTTCVPNERVTCKLGDIRGSCRSRSTGRWYKSAKG